MAATPPPPWATPPSAGLGPGRVVALVLGIVLLVLPGIGLIGAGGVLLWANSTDRSDGFLFSPSEQFSSEGYALVSERIDLQTDADWLPLSVALGTARVEVTATGSDEVFVGIAPVADATAYLGDVQRTVVKDLGFDAPANSYDQIAGGQPSGPPTEQDFWTASVTGPGTQRLTWDPAEGDWMFVMMNTDGSAGVSVDARIGATLPALRGIAWGLLAGGLFLLLLGVLVMVLALRRRPAAYAGPPYGGPPAPAGPPPAWAPPPPVDRRTAADDQPGTTRSGNPAQRPPTT
jgi:hypothetical protein